MYEQAYEMRVISYKNSDSLRNQAANWTAAHASAREHVGELPWTAGNFKDRLRQGLENWWNNLDASELKLPEFNTEDFSLPEFRLPDIELPDWANEFIGKEKAPENSDARNPV